MRAVELWRNFQVRRCKPDPLAADIVHVGEDRRNGADVAGRLRHLCGGVEVLDEELVEALVCREDAEGGFCLLREKLGSTRRHGS